jgi:hypothetical protein
LLAARTGQPQRGHHLSTNYLSNELDADLDPVGPHHLARAFDQLISFFETNGHNRREGFNSRKDQARSGYGLIDNLGLPQTAIAQIDDASNVPTFRTFPAAHVSMTLDGSGGFLI